MRLQLAVSAAVIALFGAGLVQAQTVGYAGANYERMHLNQIGSLDIARIEGAAAFRAGLVGGQVDAGATRYYGGGHVTSYGGTVHLNLHSETALIGGFAGMYTSHGETFWGGGAEAQANFGRASVYGQVGWGRTDLLKGVDFWAGKLTTSYYLTDNVKLAAYGGYTRGHQGGVGRLDMWNLGAEAEYKFENAPFSLVAGYEHAALRNTTLNSDLFRIGARYSFGGSLRDRDQTGGTLGSSADLFGGDMGQILVTSFGQLRDVVE